jgi:hypothetical protein
MRKLTILAAVAFVGVGAINASAQCDFNSSPKAKGTKTSLIRAVAACPSATFPTFNSSTGGGTPTCSPPYQMSTYQYDVAKGSCSLQTKAGAEDPCKFNSVTRACMNLTISVKCKGIVRSDGVTPISAPDDTGWILQTLSRATLDDEDNGDMTVLNFPVPIAMTEPSKGGFSTVDNSDTNHILQDLGLASLPRCTQVEIVSLTLKDPNNASFAVIGAGTR